MALEGPEGPGRPGGWRRVSQCPVALAKPCGRRAHYAVAKLIDERSDAKLTDPLQTLADCPKANARRSAMYASPRRSYRDDLAMRQRSRCLSPGSSRWKA
jgi:hypothetical protein